MLWKSLHFDTIASSLLQKVVFPTTCQDPLWPLEDHMAKRTDFWRGKLRKGEHLSYIYLGYFVCLCVIACVCVSHFVSERSAILLVLAIRLTQETRGRDWRGRDTDGEIGKRQIGEGGCEETFHCLSLNWEACRFTVPPAVALLNYISSGILWRIFFQTGFFAGFSVKRKIRRE